MKAGGETELDRSLTGLMLPDLKLSSLLKLLGDNLSLKSGLMSCWAGEWERMKSIPNERLLLLVERSISTVIFLMLMIGETVNN